MKQVVLCCLAALLLTAPALAETTQESNVAKSKRFYAEVVNQGKFEMMDEMLSDDFVEHEPLPVEAKDMSGRESVKQFFVTMKAAFDDLKFEPQFYVAQDDMVVAYVKMSGTQKKDFLGIKSSGKSFEATTIDIIRFKDGMAVEHWGASDTMGMMQQLLPEKPHMHEDE